MAKLTLKDLVANVHAQQSGVSLSKAALEDVLKLTFNNIKDSVGAGDEVRIHEFGTFSLKETPARKGRNPQTGEAIDIAASNSVKFKPVKHAK